MCPTYWTSILALLDPPNDTFRVEYVTRIALELRDLVPFLEGNETDGTIGFYGHCLRIKITPLQLINNCINLSFVLRISSASGLISERAVKYGYADDEAAEKEDGDGAEKHENDHENEPSRCVRVVLAVVVIAEINCVAPNCQNGEGQQQNKDDDQEVNQEAMGRAPENPELVQGQEHVDEADDEVSLNPNLHRNTA